MSDTTPQNDTTPGILAGLAGDGSIVDRLAATAAAQGDQPQPVMAGTFALYPTPDGGAVIVLTRETADGPETHRQRVKPGWLRAIEAAANGGGKAAVLRALIGGSRGG